MIKKRGKPKHLYVVKVVKVKSLPGILHTKTSCNKQACAAMVNTRLDGSEYCEHFYIAIM